MPWREKQEQYSHFHENRMQRKKDSVNLYQVIRVFYNEEHRKEKRIKYHLSECPFSNQYLYYAGNGDRKKHTRDTSEVAEYADRNKNEKRMQTC